MNNYSFTFDFIVLAFDEAIVFLICQRSIFGLYLILIENYLRRLFDAVVEVDAFFVLYRRSIKYWIYFQSSINLFNFKHTITG